MRVHYLQHVPFEDIGSIEPWLKIKGYEITNTKLFEAADFPSLKDIDLLVIMGGPMSVNDEEKYPWLIREKNLFMRQSNPIKLFWVFVSALN
jgi:GMP synthase-like glutamine amidotransferase